MDQKYLDRLENAREHLRSHAIPFDTGLTPTEFDDLETKFGIRFPPDLRWFLAGGVPFGPRFPKWRSPDQSLEHQLSGPTEGICFDIKNNAFWWDEWGKQPDDVDDAVSLAIRKISEAPKLIPISGHSYIAGDPCEPCNPVFSVSQADVIHRGSNLAEYLFWILHNEEDEDELREQYPVFSEDYTHIRFWTELTRENNKWL